MAVEVDVGALKTSLFFGDGGGGYVYGWLDQIGPDKRTGISVAV